MPKKTVKYVKKSVKVLSQHVRTYVSTIGFFIYGDNMNNAREPQVQRLIDLMEKSISPKTLEIINNYNSSCQKDEGTCCTYYSTVGTNTNA
jgi:hypothetical protein